MIVGRVTRDGGEARIPLTLLRGSSVGETMSLDAVIDTGFTGRLTLPPDVVEDLGLRLRGSVDVALADGSVETLPMHRVRIVWHEREREVRVYAASGSPLVGMALLFGSELRIRVAGGEAVEIEESP